MGRLDKKGKEKSGKKLGILVSLVPLQLIIFNILLSVCMQKLIDIAIFLQFGRRKPEIDQTQGHEDIQETYRGEQSVFCISL